MCKVFAEQDPAGYMHVSRSVRIGGHATSIRLEAAFWALLDEVARSQGMTTPKFLSTLYEEALESNGGVGNFASMLRTTCLLYLRGNHVPGAEDCMAESETDQIGKHTAPLHLQ